MIQRFFATFACASLAGMSVIAGVNVGFDPFNVFRHTLRLSTQIEPPLMSRTTTAEELRSKKWDVILLGSSRVQRGIPTPPPHWREKAVVNAGLLATNLYEIHQLFRFAEKNGLPRRIFFGVDLLMFNDRRTTNDDFNTSLFNEDLSIVDYYCEKLLGFRGIKESLRILGRTRPTLNLFGPTQNYPGARDAMRLTLEKYLTSTEHYVDVRLSKERLELLNEIIEDCKRLGIRLDLVVSPVHVFQMEAMDRSELWPLFERLKQELAAHVSEADKESLVHVYDLGTYDGPTTEPVPALGKMKWYAESSHYTHELGARMIEEIDTEQLTFGKRLFKENVNAWLLQVRKSRETWRRANPHEVRWLDELYRKNLAERQQALAMVTRRNASQNH